MNIDICKQCRNAKWIKILRSYYSSSEKDHVFIFCSGVGMKRVEDEKSDIFDSYKKESGILDFDKDEEVNLLKIYNVTHDTCPYYIEHQMEKWNKKTNE